MSQCFFIKTCIRNGEMGPGPWWSLPQTSTVPVGMCLKMDAQFFVIAYWSARLELSKVQVTICNYQNSVISETFFQVLHTCIRWPKMSFREDCNPKHPCLTLSAGSFVFATFRTHYIYIFLFTYTWPPSHLECFFGGTAAFQHRIGLRFCRWSYGQSWSGWWLNHQDKVN